MTYPSGHDRSRAIKYSYTGCLNPSFLYPPDISDGGKGGVEDTGGDGEQYLFRVHMRAVDMMTMTSSKATPNPIMTLISSFCRSDSWLSWEPWRRSVKEVVGGHPLPHSPINSAADTHQHHQPQLQQLRQ